GRSDDQKKDLWGSQNLGYDNGPGWRAEEVGRLNSKHSSVPSLTTDNCPTQHYIHNLKDQADMYQLILDGRTEEILPFPDAIGKRDTLSVSSFMPLHWKPWQIQAGWQEDVNQITKFLLTEEDGTLYTFGDTDGMVDTLSVSGRIGQNTWQNFS